jgi:hypothetical protein
MLENNIFLTQIQGRLTTMFALNTILSQFHPALICTMLFFSICLNIIFQSHSNVQNCSLTRSFSAKHFEAVKCIHTLDSYFSQIHFNIILINMPSTEIFLHFRFSFWYCVFCPSRLSSFDCVAMINRLPYSEIEVRLCYFKKCVNYN